MSHDFFINLENETILLKKHASLYMVLFPDISEISETSELLTLVIPTSSGSETVNKGKHYADLKICVYKANMCGGLTAPVNVPVISIKTARPHLYPHCPRELQSLLKWPRMRVLRSWT